MHRRNLGEAKKLIFERQKEQRYLSLHTLFDFCVTWCIIYFNVNGTGDIPLLLPIPGHPPWVWWLPEVTTLPDKKAFPFLEDGEDHARLNKAGRTGHKGDAGLSPLLCVTRPQVLTSYRKAGLCQRVLIWRRSLVPLLSRGSSLPAKDLVLKRSKWSPMNWLLAPALKPHSFMPPTLLSL